MHEKKLIRSASEELSGKDGRYLNWGDLVQKWELAAKSDKTATSYTDNGIIHDHISRLRRYTTIWWDKNITELTKGDSRELLNLAKGEGCSVTLRQKIKSSVNIVFRWAIEEKLALRIHISPLEGVQVSGTTEKVPMILSFEEVRKLLSFAKDQKNSWYPI